MSRKDFELIARTIKGAYLGIQTRKLLASDMADALATTNPRFDRTRFLQACGVLS